MEGETTALPSPLDECPTWTAPRCCPGVPEVHAKGDCQEEQGELRLLLPRAFCHYCMKEVVSRDVAFELVPPGCMGCVTYKQVSY